jgi:hypothetical protein
MAERVGLSHVPPRPPDHHRELALEVELVGHVWTHQRLAVSEQGVGEAQEHARRRRDVASGLLGMGAVIDTDADDPLRVGHHRQELQGRQCTVRHAAGGEPLDVVERARRECLAQARELSSGERRNVDGAVAGNDAEARIAVSYITRELHWLRSHVWSARNSEHGPVGVIARAFGTRRRRGRARGLQRIGCAPSKYLQLDERYASRK